MTKEETIKVLQSIEDRAVDFPYMTACDWVAIAAAKRHLENSLEVRVEPVSKDLEEAARKHPSAIRIVSPQWETEVESAFIAGAKWQKQQLMKDAVEGVVFTKLDDGSIMVRTHYFKSDKIDYLDEVKLIIIKEE